MEGREEEGVGRYERKGGYERMSGWASTLRRSTDKG